MNWSEMLLSHVRFAARALLRRPVFTVTAAGTLAIGNARRRHAAPDRSHRNVARPLYILQGAVLLILLIAVANVGTLLGKLLLGAFAVLAVLLAACGLYGVMSLYVTTRRGEFGIRAAIGAAPGTLIGHVIGEGMTIVGLGVIGGLAPAVPATRWLQALLYDVTPSDPAVLATVGTMLIVVAASSCYVPARRAARSDPLLVLRAE